MNRTEFILTTAIILFIAFLLGWFAHWVIHRFVRVAQGDMGELDKMAQALHEAEEARDEAIRAMHQRDAEASNQLNQSQAELAAAMEGLRAARAETDQLREYIGKYNIGQG